MAPCLALNLNSWKVVIVGTGTYTQLGSGCSNLTSCNAVSLLPESCPLFLFCLTVCHSLRYSCRRPPLCHLYCPLLPHPAHRLRGAMYLSLRPPGHCRQGTPLRAHARHPLALLCALICVDLLVVLCTLIPPGSGQKEARHTSLLVWLAGLARWRMLEGIRACWRAEHWGRLVVEQ